MMRLKIGPITNGIVIHVNVRLKLFPLPKFCIKNCFKPPSLLVIDGLTRHTQKVVDDYIALIDKTRE